MKSIALVGTGFLKLIVACLGVGWSPDTATAQSVFSVNTLGYADVNLAAGSNLVANPFSARDNSIANLFRGVPDGSFFIPWNRPMANFSPTNSFTQAQGWTDPGITLVTPNGGFLWVPTATKLSFVGEAWQGSGCAQYPAGVAVLSDLTGCQIFCDNIVGPCPGDIAADGTRVSKWNRQSQSYDEYEYIEGLGWLPDVPTLAPGESAKVSVPVPFSVRAAPGGGGAGTPPREVRANSWQRDNDRMTLRFASTNDVTYTVLRSSNLSAGIWEVLKQDSTSPTGGTASITIATETNQTSFYRLVPAFSAAGAVLMNAFRGSNQFRCEFYAPVAARYELQRNLNVVSGPWQTVATISAGASNIVSVIDTTATAPHAYYRVGYSTNN